ncbi:nucleotidyl transferase AbiEii/AbiGii toxin family protein (plasmid) [Achromobacter seleniivolatilans]|uniref:Nucleotidyl transferase AbiEii/AbiGii toxin family protein n=1 Tax=Achromobacter seleniivolatilans TaxID=3047478 RepID=A0ABY9MDR6_9BURK|nr:nucleotidyl transferase AbiEii/AbiGii toxin family protein [Achromobacter sp. R39]WMD23912.1 nucleotidyl transferase AbiEii/AbiGii toxin family protein [Achromobacter sp. R39]
MSPKAFGGGSPLKRQPLPSTTKHQWSVLLQTLLIAGFVERSRWTREEAVFHGGTSLKLGWGSPRWSEDLDFLVKKDHLQEAERHIHSAVAFARAHLARIDAALQLEVSGKTTGRMARYAVSMTKPGLLGKAMVKAEFWGVEDSYLERYPSAPRLPEPPQELAQAGYFVRVSSMLPMATLNAVMCDKLVAVANRRYFKARDIFDMYWIQQERSFVRPTPQEMARDVLFHASAYDAEMDPEQAQAPKLEFTSDQALALSTANHLRAWVDSIGTPEYLTKAQTELKTFLVDSMGGVHLWDSYWQGQVSTMIHDAGRMALECAAGLEDLVRERQNDGEGTRPAPPRDVPRG